MRIIVGHDYYDRGMGLGYDDRLVFVRSRTAVWTDAQAATAGFYGPATQVSFDPLPENRDGRRFLRMDGCFDTDAGSYHAFPITAYVCGRIFGGIAVDGPGCTWLGSHQDLSIHTMPRQVFWDRDAFIRFTAGFGFAPRASRDWRCRSGDSGKPVFDGLFARIPAPQARLDYLIANRITVLTHVPDRRHPQAALWRINGDNLADIEFFKVMDAYTLYQEMEMWIGGVLARSGNPMVEIMDDKIKIAKHGFDVARSFRKSKAA